MRKLGLISIVGLSLFCVTCVSWEQATTNPTITEDRTAIQDPASPQTRVVLLGSGNPNANPDRMGPCVAIVVNDQPYLVDFGPGVVRRAAAAFEQGVKGLAVKKLNRAFVTHLHSDHTIGYPDLILTPWILERRDPLEVYGPPGLEAMTDHIVQAYAEDIRMRLYGLEPANTTGYKVNTHEFTEPGVVYRDDNVTVKAFKVLHGSWPYAFGYRFETPDKVIVVSGDTTYSETLIENARGCDVLIHEVYSQYGFELREPEWQLYHARNHTSSIDLGKLAAKVKPGLLVLYHYMFWGATEDQLLDEIRLNYDGNLSLGRDLDIY